MRRAPSGVLLVSAAVRPQRQSAPTANRRFRFCSNSSSPAGSSNCRRAARDRAPGCENPRRRALGAGLRAPGRGALAAGRRAAGVRGAWGRAAGCRGAERLWPGFGLWGAGPRGCGRLGAERRARSIGSRGVGRKALGRRVSALSFLLVRNAGKISSGGQNSDKSGVFSQANLSIKRKSPGREFSRAQTPLQNPRFTQIFDHQRKFFAYFCEAKPAETRRACETPSLARAGRPRLAGPDRRRRDLRQRWSNGECSQPASSLR